jgi:hypothetical protein
MKRSVKVLKYQVLKYQEEKKFLKYAENVPKLRKLSCTIPRKFALTKLSPCSHQALRNIWFSEHYVLAGR